MADKDREQSVSKENQDSENIRANERNVRKLQFLISRENGLVIAIIAGVILGIIFHKFVIGLTVAISLFLAVGFIHGTVAEENGEPAEETNRKSEKQE